MSLKDASRLDDMAFMHSLDRSDMLSRLMTFSRQCRDALSLADLLEFPVRAEDASAVAIAGMGGSAIGGDILQAYLADRLEVPVFVIRDYGLPGYIDTSCLLFTVSYSGNTEEVLSVFAAALARGIPSVTITSGGRLKTLTTEAKRPVIDIPPGYPPRAALGFLFFPMLAVLRQKGFCEPDNDVEETIGVLERQARACGPEVPAGRNPAKQIATALSGHMPVFYGARRLAPVVRRWRTQLAENAGVFAHGDLFPELNHNEIMSWPGLTAGHKGAVVLLRDQGDTQNQKRITISKEMLQADGLPCLEVWTEGESLLARIFSLICLGDFVSYYLAMLCGIDPTPVERIEQFKRRLDTASSHGQ